MGLPGLTVAAALLSIVSLVLAHGDDEGHGMDMKKPAHPPSNGGEVDPYDMPSYAGLSQYQTQIICHVVFMVLAWFFILPIGEYKQSERASIELIPVSGRLQLCSVKIRSAGPVPVPRRQCRRTDVRRCV